MYGQGNLGDLHFGKIKHTAFILKYLTKEPAGAEGHISHQFLSLNANLHEMLKDGQAGEKKAVMSRLPELVGRDDLIGKRLAELFEIQVNHPIKVRLLVGPAAQQKQFMDCGTLV
jgi:hypothetical protein